MEKDEQQIHDTFSAIKVDTLGFEKKLDFTKTTKTKQFSKLPKLAAAILIFGFLSVATVYAAGDGWAFLQNIFSPFAEIAVVPTGRVYAEDQGIRIEILGAEEIDGMVLLFLSVQDVSGKHDFNSMVSPFPSFTTEISSSQHRINFDAATKTHYFQVLLRMEENVPNLQTLNLGITNLWNGDGGFRLYGDWSFAINLSDTIHPRITLENIEFSINDIDFNLEYLRVNPLAIHINGIVASDALWRFEWLLPIHVEVGLEEIIGGMMSSWRSDSYENFVDATINPAMPIDVENVTAIIINGVRIPVSQD